MTNILLVIILLVLLFGSGAILSVFGYGLGAIIFIAIFGLLVIGLIGIGEETRKQIEIFFIDTLGEKRAGIFVVSVVIIIFIYLFVRIVILGNRWY